VPWLLVAVVVAVLVMARPAYAVKPGTALSVEPEIVSARHTMAGIYARRGYQLMVTSSREGKHGDGSFHYLGLAEDYRVRDPGSAWSIPDPERAAIVTEARIALGPLYDVVLKPDHIHVEYDPR